MIRKMNTWYNEEIHFFLIQFDINFVLNGINHQKTNQIYKIPIVMPIKKRIHSHNQRIHVFWTFLRVLCWKYWFLQSFMLIWLDIRSLISRLFKWIIPNINNNPLVYINIIYMFILIASVNEHLEQNSNWTCNQNKNI